MGRPTKTQRGRTAKGETFGSAVVHQCQRTKPSVQLVQGNGGLQAGQMETETVMFAK